MTPIETVAYGLLLTDVLMAIVIALAMWRGLYILKTSLAEYKHDLPHSYRILHLHVTDERISYDSGNVLLLTALVISLAGFSALAVEFCGTVVDSAVAVCALAAVVPMAVAYLEVYLSFKVLGTNMRGISRVYPVDRSYDGLRGISEMARWFSQDMSHIMMAYVPKVSAILLAGVAISYIVEVLMG